VESSKVRIVEKLRAEAFARFVDDQELEEFERELRSDLHQRGAALSWDTARKEIQALQGIFVEKPVYPPPIERRHDITTSTDVAFAYGDEPLGLGAGDLSLSPTMGDSHSPTSDQDFRSPVARPSAPTPKASGTEDDEDDFGDAPYLLNRRTGSHNSCSSKISLGPMASEWHVRSQQPWQLAGEHCTLTIHENASEELIQFELLKHRSHANMILKCTNAQFDQLCREQTGLSGTNQINAAISQLFREAVEELDRPRGRSKSELSHEDFGEDHAHEFAAAAATATVEGEAKWHIKSQQPWQIGRDHFTLTILENSGEALLQFELLKHITNTTMYVTCTNEQFEQLIREQTGLFGTAQVNAAISQLFTEAHEEIGEPLSSMANLDPVEEFGEDFDADNFEPRLSERPDDVARWHIKSQQPWQLGQEHCTLTILENSIDGMVQFELLKMSTNATMYVSCTNAQFDELLNEQCVDLVGVAQVNAAISQLFREAHAELERPHSPLDPVDEFGEDSADENDVAGNAKGESCSGWHVRSHQHKVAGCELTILENKGDGLVQFELLKTSTNTTMYVTCTNEQFDSLVNEQAGLTGTAQVDAAIAQLFREAHEEIEKPTGGANGEDDFGEDFGADFADIGGAGGSATSSQAGWHIKSQQPWQLAKEHCTLTILENSAEDLVQFELLNNATNATMYVTCTNVQFDELLEEQSGLQATAKVNAAIAQMFTEAHQEIQWPQPGESSRKESEQIKETSQKRRASRQMEEFGEDNDCPREDSRKPPREMPSAESRWCIRSQQPWELENEHCTLTILENPGDGFLQFELLKHSNHTTVYVMCTDEQFESLCSELKGVAGSVDQTNAAIRKLFDEAQDELKNS